MLVRKTSVSDVDRMRGLDLFSGIGGLSLALEEWVKPIAYCENDRYAQSVLLSRMSTGELSVAPIWDDVCTLRAADLPSKIDIVYGGFPCQNIALVGHGIGLEGEQSGLYWQLHRLIQETSPTFVFLENVPGIRTRGLREVVESLTKLGYDCRWTIVSAAEVGAKHIRKRWFLLAHSSSERRQQIPGRAFGYESENERRETETDHQPKCPPQENIWQSSHADLHGVVNGLPNKLERTRAMGNAVVPKQAKAAFSRLLNL